MAIRPFQFFLPTADDVVNSDLPTLGRILLVVLKSYEGQRPAVYQQIGGINRQYFFDVMEHRNVGLGPLPGNGAEYGARQPEVSQALREAWNWLEKEGYLMLTVGQGPDWFSLTRSGEEQIRRFNLHEQLEKLGLDRVRTELNKEKPRVGTVGGGPNEKDWIWEWVRIKEQPGATLNGPPKQAGLSKKVFIVHGHDDGAREAVARFLERIGLEPLILHEQANRGRTIIEKFEAHRDVGFAVVVLTPDDEGCERGGMPRPRARQNVVLELGYFVGVLGRHKVCALRRGDVEIPSDFTGVVYVPLDEANGWKQALGRELEAAGFQIDWKKAMAPN
jgi:hypothetical protein